MSFKTLFLLSFLPSAFLLLAPDPALGGWGGGSCPPVGGPGFYLSRPQAVPFAAAAAPRRLADVTPGDYAWRPFSDGSTDQLLLARGGTQVGVYVRKTGLFWWLADDGTWSRGEPPLPVPPPDACKCGKGCAGDGCACGCRCACGCAGCKGKKDKDGNCGCGKDCPMPTANFGVATDRLAGREAPASYKVCEGGVTREVTRAEAAKVMAGGGKERLVDDSTLLRFTLKGEDSFTGPVLADLASHPALAPWKARVLAQAYRPADWPVAARGLDHAISLRTPDGREVLALDSYPGPEALAGAIDAALNPRPPAPAPDGKPSPLSSPSAGPSWYQQVPWSVWVFASLVLAYILLDRLVLPRLPMKKPQA